MLLNDLDERFSLGSASSIPPPPEHGTPQVPQRRGGEAVPSEVMLAVMKAHRSWALRFCPWTLEEWE